MTRQRLTIRPARVTRRDAAGCWVEFDVLRCAGCVGSCQLGKGGPGPVRVADSVPGTAVGSRVAVAIDNDRLRPTIGWLFGAPLAALLGTPLAVRALDAGATDTTVAALSLAAAVTAGWFGMRRAAGAGRLLRLRLVPAGSAMRSGGC